MDWVVEVLLDGTGLDIWSFALLCAASMLGSFLTAALGLGGGVLTLATMALFLPPAVLIPVHAVVQLGSNTGRVALMFRDVLRDILPVFLLGTLVGALIGGQLVVALPVALLQGVLALFVLYAAWVPKFKARKPGKAVFFGVATISSFATMFVGATGPLVAPFVMASCDRRQQVVATHAALMTMQHALKLVVFGVLGFSFGPYLPLLAGLLVSGFAGTFAGRHALNKLPEAAFRTGLKVILSLVAARLFHGAISG